MIHTSETVYRNVYVCENGHNIVNGPWDRKNFVEHLHIMKDACPDLFAYRLNITPKAANKPKLSSSDISRMWPAHVLKSVPTHNIDLKGFDPDHD